MLLQPFEHLRAAVPGTSANDVCAWEFHSIAGSPVVNSRWAYTEKVGSLMDREEWIGVHSLPLFSALRDTLTGVLVCCQSLY